MSSTLSNSETTSPVAAENEAATRVSDKPKSESKILSVPLVQALVLIGTFLFAASHLLLWWELELVAPQFPGGLYVQATSYEIQESPKTPFNDINEVDGLNHYIGMMSLGDAAQLEMSIAIPAIIVLIVLGVAAFIWRSRWSALLTIPIVVFPFAYWADLQFWLWYAGNNLDDTAAITLEPFTPPAIGTGTIAQFSTVSSFQPGWYVAAAAAAVCLAAIILSIVRKPEA